ncbi:hypothetical protein AB0M89_27345 [Streptomyces microflavus]|uniref:hypothetical protein n=1 Tax=Streptomyces microflavus TaxID=1919 RepID=UPI0034125124
MLNERSLGTVLTPQQSAGILRALASFGGVEYHRGVQDRPDVREWFSPSSPISGASAEEADRHLRPGYRETLAYEEMLTEDADDLNVRVPSVTEYTTHLSRGYSN